MSPHSTRERQEAMTELRIVPLEVPKKRSAVKVRPPACPSPRDLTQQEFDRLRRAMVAGKEQRTLALVGMHWLGLLRLRQRECTISATRQSCACGNCLKHHGGLADSPDDVASHTFRHSIAVHYLEVVFDLCEVESRSVPRFLREEGQWVTPNLRKREYQG
jgi:hypothetical protein